MLLGNFFTISSMEDDGSSASLLLELNAGHAIFNGHFPSMPVVPGVCMMQMVQEIMEKITGRSLLLSRADQVKFLMVIDPVIYKVLQADISHKVVEDGSIYVTANLYAGAAACFKFRGNFTDSLNSVHHPIP